MKIKPVLSICIPTFQRKDSLKRTLDKIVEIQKIVGKKIEVCISDNCSTDGTFELISAYKNKYSFVKINRNKENLGFDLNLTKSLKMANGRYCWGIGDDDTLLSQGIISLINLLEKEKSFVFGLAGAVANQMDVELLKNDFEKKEYTINEFIDKLILIIKKASKIKKCYKDITILGFLPNYFFNNEILKKSFGNLEGKRHGWYHLALLFYILSNFNGEVLINKEIALKHGQNQSHKKDNLLIPGEEFELFLNRRVEALKDIKIEKKLKDSFYNWLNLRGNYFYVKSLAELTVFFEKIDIKEYEIMKKKVYLCKERIKMPIFILFGTSFFRIIERSAFFKKLISKMYSKIHRNYIDQINLYLKGHLTTNDQREGKNESLKLRKKF